MPTTAELAIDAETLEMLEGQVKKGKTRKFILIYKGSQIKRLIVFKKGPYNTRIQQAKKEGFRGSVVTGLVNGSGVNLSFQMAGTQAVAGVMGSDGVVEKEPTKTAKLREFLADNKLKRKPTYKVIKSESELRPASDEKGESKAQVRVVNGGGGYVYEQSADGSIVIVESPRRGTVRTPVRRGSKAFKAILAEIGPFSKPSGKRSSADASGVLGALLDATGDAADFMTGAVGGVVDALTGAPDVMGGAETETEKKLAEFTQAMSNIVVTVDGKPVKVRPPYHWNREDHKIRLDAEAARKKNGAVNRLLKKVFKGQFGSGAKTGKATPEQMQAFLQAAIDAGLVKDTSAKGLKEFLDTYGVSTDCSGLATQALNFLNDGDMKRGPDEEIDTSNVGTGTIARYPKVRKPSDLRAGDTMVLGGSHVRIITDVDVEDDGVYFTTLESTTANVSEHGKGVGERRWRFPNSERFKNLQDNKSGKFKRSSSREQEYIYTRHKSL